MITREEKKEVEKMSFPFPCFKSTISFLLAKRKIAASRQNMNVVVIKTRRGCYPFEKESGSERKEEEKYSNLGIQR